MNDLTDRLASLGEGRTGPPPESTVSADLRRGRAALRRKRNRMRASGALSVAAVALAGAGAYVVTSGTATPAHQHVAAAAQHHSATARHRHASAVARQHGKGAPQNLKVKLVDYTGKQPAGFKIASVPQGFNLQLQASQPSKFVLAPPGATKDPEDFEGKMVVTAETASDLGNWQTFGERSVTINGQHGRIGRKEGPGVQLWFDAGNGVVVDVQAWQNIHITDQQLIDFADGVATTPALQLSHG